MTEDAPESRFQHVHAKKASGTTYTPPELASFVAGGVADRARLDGAPWSPLRILDPAVGDGELLVQLVAVLRARGVGALELLGFDVDGEALEVARKRLSGLTGCTVRLVCGDFLAEDASKWGVVDAVVANPPYVRTQVLGEERAQAVAKRHGLQGRVDLYQAFMVALTDWVKDGGVVGLITSNRFLSVKAGADVRRHLWSHFAVSQVWDLGDTKLFDAAVLPAVTVLVRGETPAGHVSRMTTVYGCDGEGAVAVDGVFSALSADGVVRLPDGRGLEVQQGRVVTSADGGDLWRLGNDEVDAWLHTVRRNTWKELGEVGKIRVGIKTTADAVFIHDGDTEGLELLRPLTTHHVGRRYRAMPVCKQVLYTHEVVDGRRQAVDLRRSPRSKAFLETHRARLEGRSYVAKAKRQWFEIWVPHDPSSWSRPKLVFRDIVDTPQFWVDLTGSVVNGDCYWMVADHEDLLWLAVAVCNTTFIETFYDRRFNNKLYAGRRRYLTQYVKHFPLPDPARPESQQLIALAKRAYAGEDVDVEGLVERAFGVA